MLRFNNITFLVVIHRVEATNGALNVSKISLGRNRVYDAQFLGQELVLLIGDVKGAAIMILDVEELKYTGGGDGDSVDFDRLEGVRKVVVDDGFVGGVEGGIDGVLLACNEGRRLVSLVCGNRTWIHVCEDED
jgi:hypothetical protein